VNDQERLERFRSIVGRVWKMPTAGDCIRFVYQELGEADSLAMRLGFQGKEYLRNNEADTDGLDEELEMEMGQAYMMLLSYASAVGVHSMERALWRAMFHQYNKIKYHLDTEKRLTWEEADEAFEFLYEEYGERITDGEYNDIS